MTTKKEDLIFVVTFLVFLSPFIYMMVALALAAMQ